MGQARPGLAWALCIVLGLTPGCRDPSPAEARARNVILISIDTLRADHLGCYGYERSITPNIDQLASRGALFLNASSTGSWTMPAHASMLTGVYPRSHGVTNWSRALPRGLDTLAERLAGAGFRTGAIVNLKAFDDERGFTRGFESFTLVPRALEAERQAEAILDESLAWLQARDERPFFLFLHVFDVHSDYGAADEFKSGLVRDYTGRVDGTTRQLRKYRKGFLGPWTQADRDHLIDLYDAGIRELDDRLGVLFDALDEQSLLEDTLLVFTADHGEELLDHGGVLHDATLFQELIHVPLILIGPEIPAGARVASNASLVDLVPTVLGRVGMPIPPELAGRDLCASWSAALEVGPERPIFAEADFWHDQSRGDFQRVVRLGDLKLYYQRSSGRSRLYDLRTDPGETVDLADERTADVERLLRELETFSLQASRHSVDLELPESATRELEALGYF